MRPIVESEVSAAPDKLATQFRATADLGLGGVVPPSFKFQPAMARPTVGIGLTLGANLSFSGGGARRPLFDLIEHWSTKADEHGTRGRATTSQDLPHDTRNLDRALAGAFHPSATMGALREIPYASLIKTMVEAGKIDAARSLLVALEPGPVAVEELRRVLRLPTTRLLQELDSNRARDYEWLKLQGTSYRGKWVAIESGCLLAEADSLRSLRERLRADFPSSKPLVHRID